MTARGGPPTKGRQRKQPDELTDAELHRLCLENDEAAWEWVFRFCVGVGRWRRWGLASRAEELAGDVVVRLIEGGIRKIDDPGRFRPWLKRVMANYILGFLDLADNAWTKSIDTPDGDEHQPLRDMIPQEDFFDDLVSRDLLERVDGALKSLGPKCRRVVSVYLDYKLGVHEDYADIARLLKTNEKTAASWIHRCMGSFRNQPEVEEIFRDFRVRGRG